MEIDMFTAIIQSLESRFEQFVAVYKKLKVENASLTTERDGLLRERQLMRAELDRILSRFEKIDEETS